MAKPSGLTATAASSSEIDLSWDANSLTADEYLVERSEDGANFTQVGTSDDGTFQDTGLDPDKQYTYQVRASLDGGMKSDPSDPASATTDALLPTITIGGTSVAAGQTFTLTATATFPSNNPDGDGVTQWKIDWGDQKTDTFDTAEGPFTHIYQTPGLFTITATATCKGGDVEATTTATITPGTATVTLSNPSAHINIGDTYSFTATITPRNNANVGKVLAWVVDFGDGSGDTEQAQSPAQSAPASHSFSHSYPHGGTTFPVTVGVVTETGVFYPETSNLVTVNPGPGDPNPNPPPGTPPSTFGVSGPTSTTPGSNGQATITVIWCAPNNPQTGSGVVQWGDDPPTAGSPHGVDATPISTPPPDPNGGNTTQHTTATHEYSEEGYYLVQVFGQSPSDDGTSTYDNGDYGAAWIWAGDDESTDTEWKFNKVDDKTANVGDPVDITATMSKAVPSKDKAYAYVDWGDGTGLHQASLNGTQVTAHLDHAPMGVHTITLWVFEGHNAPFASQTPEVISTTLQLLVDDPVLLVDANNDDGLAPPTEANTPPSEQALFKQAGPPGKIIQVDNKDLDGNGVPDFAEGYGLFDDLPGGTAPPTKADGAGFVPITVALPIWALSPNVSLKFTYGQSDPSSVTRTLVAGQYVYTPDTSSGDLRIWLKDEDQDRNPNSVGSGGDWVSSGETIPGSKLTWSADDTAVLYVEAVGATAAVEPITLQVTATSGKYNGKTTSSAVLVSPVSFVMGVDNNGNGTIGLDGRDLTTPTNPFRFWLNDNADVYTPATAGMQTAEFGGGAATDPYLAPDTFSTMIGSRYGTNNDPAKLKEVFRRDLQDFAQVGLAYSSAVASAADKVVFTITGATNPNMSIRLWRSELLSSGAYGHDDSNQSYYFSATNHLTDAGAADGIMAVTYNALYHNVDSFRGVYAGSLTTLSMSDFERQFGMKDLSTDHIFRLMFEGISPGKGTVDIKFMHGNALVAESAFTLDLHPSTDLYEHYSVSYGAAVGPDGSAASDPKYTPIKTTAQLVDGTNAASYAKTKDYFLYVHGWNMDEKYRIAAADVAYKRLYWQGFRGTFGLFDWPTQHTDNPLTDAGNFNRSEEVAWNSAAGLYNLLVSKQSARTSGGKLVVLAHSMGNIVLAESLKIAGSQRIIDSGVFSQAALSSDYFAGSGVDTSLYPAFGGQVGGAAPRFSSIGQAAGKLVNFANPNDYALRAWLGNDRAKPGGPIHETSSMNPLTQLGFGYAIYDSIAGPPASITRTVPGAAPVKLNIATDAYEMFANGLYAPTQAMGAIPAAPGPFLGFVDLSQPKFGFGWSRTDHSGEFNHSLIEMDPYWQEVMRQTGVH